jgi:hypothetical protein
MNRTAGIVGSFRFQRRAPKDDVTAVYDTYDMLAEKRAAVTVLGNAVAKLAK